MIFNDLRSIERWNQLPSGYTEVSYLRSTGTQYINTGIYGQISIEIEAQIHTSGQQTIVGSQRSSPPWAASFIRRDSTNKITFCAFSSNQTTLNINEGNAHKYLADMYTDFMSCTVDGVNMVSATISATILANVPYYLFAMGQEGDTAVQKGNISIFGHVIMYSDKLHTNTILHLIPCIDSSNVPMYYDTVSRQFFTNQGTGVFTYG